MCTYSRVHCLKYDDYIQHRKLESGTKENSRNGIQNNSSTGQRALQTGCLKVPPLRSTLTKTPSGCYLRSSFDYSSVFRSLTT